LQKYLIRWGRVYQYNELAAFIAGKTRPYKSVKNAKKDATGLDIISRRIGCVSDRML
jgi:hypothetical protein